QLSLAAYNWGEGSVQRAIRRQERAGQPTDYSHLRMPSETANYVPKLEAIKRIVSEPEKYGVKLPDVGNEPFFVTITKPTDIDTKTAAKLAGMSLTEFKQLNPSFKLPVIVAAHNNVMLLPADRVDEFIDNLVSWMDNGQPLSRWTTYKMKAGETLASVAERVGMTEEDLRSVNRVPAGRKVLANSTLLVRANTDEQVDISAAAADAELRLSPLTTWRRVNYRVRRGDTLNSIASRWHITQRSIIKNNRLRTSRLSAGQRLILTVPNVKRAPIREVQRPTVSR
ncbi:membrane-bound lytic murein transglycosylase D precursor, partial [gut metagenome]